MIRNLVHRINSTCPLILGGGLAVVVCLPLLAVYGLPEDAAPRKITNGGKPMGDSYDDHCADVDEDMFPSKRRSLDRIANALEGRITKPALEAKYAGLVKRVEEFLYEWNSLVALQGWEEGVDSEALRSDQQKRTELIADRLRLELDKLREGK